MLSWPSLEVLQAMVLLAWSEFGSGRDSGELVTRTMTGAGLNSPDSGLWIYSRMAVAMAMDLGA